MRIVLLEEEGLRADVLTPRDRGRNDVGENRRHVPGDSDQAACDLEKFAVTSRHSSAVNSAFCCVTSNRKVVVTSQRGIRAISTPSATPA